MKKTYSNATVEFLVIEAENVLLLASSEVVYSDDNDDVKKVNFADWE